MAGAAVSMDQPILHPFVATLREADTEKDMVDALEQLAVEARLHLGAAPPGVAAGIEQEAELADRRPDKRARLVDDLLDISRKTGIPFDVSHG